MRLLLRVSAFCVIAGALATTALAQPNASWLGGTSNDFADPANWSFDQGAVDFSSDTRLFINDASPNPNPVYDPATSGWNTYPSVIWDLQIGTNLPGFYTDLSETPPANMGTPGTFTQQSGDLSVWYAVNIGTNGATGLSSFNLNGGTFTKAWDGGDLHIGTNGSQGVLAMTGNAVYTHQLAGETDIGAWGGAGSLTMSGTSKFNQGGDNWFWLGRGSTGVISLSGSSTFETHQNGGYFVFGVDAGGNGTVALNDYAKFIGSQTGQMTVGMSGGSGTIDMSQNATTNYSTFSHTTGTLAVGDGGGASGTILMDGYTTLDVTGNHISLAQYGGTALLQTAGNAAVKCNSMALALWGGNGVVSMSGSSTINISDWMNIGDQGAGTFTMIGNSAVDVNRMSVGVGAGSGLLEVGGDAVLTTHGDLSVGNGAALGGILNLSGGKIQQLGGWTNIGQNAGANGTVTVTGGTYVATGVLFLARDGGNGTWNQNGGQTIANCTTYMTNDGAGGTAILNLNAGVYATYGIATWNDGVNGTQTTNFDGGTLKALTDNGSFFTNTTTGANPFTVNLLSTGNFDTNGYNVGMGMPLSGAGSLTKIGRGNLTLANANATTGTINVNVGQVTLATATPFSGAGNAIAVAANAALGVNLGGAGTVTATTTDVTFADRGRLAVTTDGATTDRVNIGKLGAAVATDTVVVDLTGVRSLSGMFSSGDPAMTAVSNTVLAGTGTGAITLVNALPRFSSIGLYEVSANVVGGTTIVATAYKSTLRGFIGYGGAEGGANTWSFYSDDPLVLTNWCTGYGAYELYPDSVDSEAWFNSVSAKGLLGGAFCDLDVPVTVNSLLFNTAAYDTGVYTIQKVGTTNTLTLSAIGSTISAESQIQVLGGTATIEPDVILGAGNPQFYVAGGAKLDISGAITQTGGDASIDIVGGTTGAQAVVVLSSEDSGYGGSLSVDNAVLSTGYLPLYTGTVPAGMIILKNSTLTYTGAASGTASSGFDVRNTGDQLISVTNAAATVTVPMDNPNSYWAVNNIFTKAGAGTLKLTNDTPDPRLGQAVNVTDGGTLYLASSVPTIYSVDDRIGSENNAVLVTDGTILMDATSALYANSARIGCDGTPNSDLTISGGRVHLNYEIKIAEPGAGTLTLDHTNVVCASYLVVGNSGGNGALNVHDSTLSIADWTNLAVWPNNWDDYIGGTASVTINGNSTVTFGNGITAAYAADGATASIGIADTSNVTVIGNLSMAEVNRSFDYVTDLSIAGTSSLNITGALVVGNGCTNNHSTISVSGSSTLVANGNGDGWNIMGDDAHGANPLVAITISGNSQFINTNNLEIAAKSDDGYGYGTLEMSGASLLYAGNEIRLGYGGVFAGTMSGTSQIVTGGNLHFGLWGGTSTMEMNPGTAIHAGGDFNILDQGAGVGSLTMNQASITVGNGLYIATSNGGAEGTLNMIDSTASANNVNLGWQGGHGTLTMSGASQLTADTYNQIGRDPGSIAYISLSDTSKLVGTYNETTFGTNGGTATILMNGTNASDWVCIGNDNTPDDSATLQGYTYWAAYGADPGSLCTLNMSGYSAINTWTIRGPAVPGDVEAYDLSAGTNGGVFAGTMTGASKIRSAVFNFATGNTTDGNYSASSLTMGVAGGAGVDTANIVCTGWYNIGGYGSSATVTMNAYTAFTSYDQGTIAEGTNGWADFTMNDHSTFTAPRLRISGGTGAVGVVTLNGHSAMAISGNLYASASSSGAGTLTVNDFATVNAGKLYVGWGNGLSRTNVAGGTVTTASDLNVGWNWGSLVGEQGDHVATVSGGTVNVGGELILGPDSGKGTYTQTAGQTTVTGNVILGEGDYTDSLADQVGAHGDAVLNLSGGTFTAPGMTTRSVTISTHPDDITMPRVHPTTGIVNFNGALVVASATNPDFIHTDDPLASVTLNVLANGAKINTNGNTVTINKPLLNGTGGGADGGVTKLGAGTLVLTTVGGTSSYTGVSTVEKGTLQLNGPGARKPVLTAGGANVKNDWTKLVIDYAGESTPKTAVYSALKAGYLNGWNAGAATIYSTTSAASGGNRTLGWKDDGLSQITIMVTIPGDLDMNGQVDQNDFDICLGNVGSAAGWSQGDFNYNEVVDQNDFDVVLGNFGQAMPPLAPIAGAMRAASSTVVPEPGTLALLAAGLIGLLAYAWRKRK